MALSLASLLIEESKAAIYEKAIAIANAIGLPVSSWQPGDPTRSLFHLESEVLTALETLVVGFIRSGFLEYSAEAAATGDEDARTWLKVNADQMYGVTVPEATFATTDVVLTNSGGGYYDENDTAAGALTFRNSTTGKTYRNTTSGILESGPGTTLTLTVIADEAGAASSAGVGEIDELVTPLLGVTCSNAIAAVGVDEQDPATTVLQCKDKLDTLSPDGPKGAYSFVARDPELSGTSAVTRVRVYPDSDTGDVLVYLAGPAGGVLEADRALVEEAILQHATPLCITPTVLAASNVTVAVTYQLWIYKSVNKTAAEIEAEIETALEQMFATRDIGGDIIAVGGAGFLYKSVIESTILSVFPQAFRVSASSPSGDTAIGNHQVATIGAVTGTITIVTDP